MNSSRIWLIVKSSLRFKKNAYPSFFTNNFPYESINYATVWVQCKIHQISEISYLYTVLISLCISYLLCVMPKIESTEVILDVFQEICFWCIIWLHAQKMYSYIIYFLLFFVVHGGPDNMVRKGPFSSTIYCHFLHIFTLFDQTCNLAW